MLLSNYQPRQKHKDSNPHEIIPISLFIYVYNMYSISQEKNIKYRKFSKISITDTFSSKIYWNKTTRGAWCY